MDKNVSLLKNEVEPILVISLIRSAFVDKLDNILFTDLSKINLRGGSLAQDIDDFVRKV